MKLSRMVGQIITMKLLKVVFVVGSAPLVQSDSIAQGAAIVSLAASQPTFDIVSIHPMEPSDARPEHIDNPYRRGYLKAVNVSLKSLIEIAYDIPDLRMFGGPTWLNSSRFSLEAKADASVDEELATLPSEQAKEAKRTMIVALLTQRFKLAVHAEAREMPVYAMVIGKGGPKLTGTQQSDSSQSGEDQFIKIRPGSDSLQILAYELSWRVGRPVLDKTGLRDKQALTLRWRGDDEASVDSNGTSLFTAIQEQLGLKLDSTKGSVPVLLIDHAEKPIQEE